MQEAKLSGAKGESENRRTEDNISRAATSSANYERASWLWVRKPGLIRQARKAARGHKAGQGSQGRPLTRQARKAGLGGLGSQGKGKPGSSQSKCMRQAASQAQKACQGSQGRTASQGKRAKQAGLIRQAMEIHGYPWRFMDIHGCPGYPWISTDIHGHP